MKHQQENHQWLEFSRDTHPTRVFILSVLLWYIPNSNADELVFWYAYHSTEKQRLYTRFYKLLPKSMLNTYVRAKQQIYYYMQDNIKRKQPFCIKSQIGEVLINGLDCKQAELKLKELLALGEDCYIADNIV